jgi:uncharacterized membrane protein YraQ (UPF0718 family)
MKKSWLSSLLFITYIATSVTGLFMLFHIKFPGLYPVHEWVGLAFVIAGVFHVIINWRIFVSYFSKGNLKRNATLGTVIGLILIIAIAFTIPSNGGHGSHKYHATLDTPPQNTLTVENS